MNIKQLAGCVLCDPDGRVLLLHRKHPQYTQWEIPGGKVEAGEDPEQAAIRETYEELGVEVDNLRLLGVTEFEAFDDHWQYHWYRADIVSGTPYPRELRTHNAVDYFDLSTPNSKLKLSASAQNLAKQLQNKQITL